MWQSIVLVFFLGCGVSSSNNNALSNKHLKVVAVPWNPFLVWKCPTHTHYVDWWQLKQEKVDRHNKYEVSGFQLAT